MIHTILTTLACIRLTLAPITLQPQPTTGPFNFSFSIPAPAIHPTARQYIFDGRIESPDADHDNGWVVVLIGGGLGNDVDWTIPPELSAAHRAHADGADLAMALTKAGFTTVRWSTIRRDSPFADQWPDRAEVRTYHAALDEARAAVLAADKLPRTGGLILVGFSLGAARACQVASDVPRVKGLALLSGAMLCRTGPEHVRRRLTEGALAHDADASGSLSPDEFLAWGAAPAPFERFDGEHDGQLMGWELLAAAVLPARRAYDPEADLEASMPGPSWPEDAIFARALPTLAIYGTRDANHAHHGILLEERARAANANHVTVQYLPGFGHTLGKDAKAPDGSVRFGPMDRSAIESVVAWCAERAR